MQRGQTVAKRESQACLEELISSMLLPTSHVSTLLSDLGTGLMALAPRFSFSFQAVNFFSLSS